MAGFNQLVKELERRFPEDWWIASRREFSRLVPDAFPEIQIYEKAISNLDEKSWLVLSEKAHAAFVEPRTKRGKNQFFSLLNESLAYEYLTEQGLVNVRLLSADPKLKTPDISYERNGELRYCEVKTIGVSDEEIGRVHSGASFHCAIYCELSQQFLAKLRSTISVAEGQILAVSGPGIIYLIVHFDDSVLDHYETYHRQISEFLASEYPRREIVVRVGIARARYIWHGIK